MFITVLVLKFYNLVSLAFPFPLCFAPLRFTNHFSKRKTGKKKAVNSCGEAGNQKETE
jgi:hypothetical protein